MDAEWCIVCDTKILASNETCAASAYCSSHCFAAAHADASSRPSSSAMFSPVSTYPRPLHGSLSQPQKIASGFTFSSAGLGEVPLNSSSQSAAASIATSTFSRPAALKPVVHHNLTPRVRLDAIYPTHSVALNLERLWTQQFLSGSQPGSSPKSDLSCQPTCLASFNVSLQGLHQTAYIFPDEEASEGDTDEPKHLDLGLNLGPRNSTKTKPRESRGPDGQRGRSSKIRSIAAVYP